MGYTLAWTRLDGQSGHEAGLRLLEKLYREKTGEDLPQIARTGAGKPYFLDSHWHFSISHTKNHAFCVLSRGNLGLDAEEMGRKVGEKLVGRFLSEPERRRLGAENDAGALRLWVLKEALAKQTGRGIGNWLKETDFDPNDERITMIDGCYVAVLEEENAV